MKQHAPWRAKPLGAYFLGISGKSLSDHDTVVTEDVRARCSAASALRSLTQNSAGSLVLYPGNNYLDRVLEFLFDSCSLTRTSPQIIKLCTSYLTFALDFYVHDHRAVGLKNPLYTLTMGDLAHGK